MIFRGLMHLHTQASKDAELTLEDYVDVARREGLSFLLFAEHRHSMSDEEVREAAMRCDSLSTDDLLLVPGQEQQTDRGIHILGLGLREPLVVTDRAGVVQEIAERGGLSCLAHPVRYARASYVSILDDVDAIESWNMRYDGRVGPREDVRRLLGEHPHAIALAGVDAHKIEELGDRSAPRLVVDLPRLDEALIFAALRAREFHVERSGVRLNVRERPSLVHRCRASMGRGAFRVARGVKQGLERVGIKFPRKLVRSVRRRF